MTSLCTTFHSSSHISHSIISSLFLGSEAETRTLRVENNVLALKEDITEDGESNARVALDTTVAGGATGGNRSIVDQRARDHGIIATNGDSEVGQSSGAREDVATNRVAVLGARDLLVIGRDNRVVEQEKSGTSI
jgi:hypothetical protein